MPKIPKISTFFKLNGHHFERNLQQEERNSNTCRPLDGQDWVNREHPRVLLVSPTFARHLAQLMSESQPVTSRNAATTSTNASFWRHFPSPKYTSSKIQHSQKLATSNTNRGQYHCRRHRQVEGRKLCVLPKVIHMKISLKFLSIVFSISFATLISNIRSVWLNSHLGSSHYQNSQKWPSFTETCNRNWTPRSLGKSLTSICCRPSWMAAINRIHKSGCYQSQSQHGDLQQKT